MGNTFPCAPMQAPTRCLPRTGPLSAAPESRLTLQDQLIPESRASGTTSGGPRRNPGPPATSPVRWANTRTLSRVRADVLGRLPRLLLPQALAAYLRGDPVENVIDIQMRIPGVEGAHGRGFPHPFPVLADTRHHDGAPIRRPESKITTCDLETRRHPLHIPLPAIVAPFLPAAGRSPWPGTGTGCRHG